jgi:two-component system, sensor histidine kinase PdtaS
MLSKYTFLFFLLISGHFAMAQSLELKVRIERVDSLMDKYFTNHDQALQESEDLYHLLTTKYKAVEFKGFKIDVMLQKATLYSLKGEHHKSLRISLEALDEAEKYKFPERIYRSCWTIAIFYENGGELDLCRKYLDKAYKTYKEYTLDHIYSVYCIRMSSYFRCVDNRDSALHFAYKGLDYAQKHQNKREIRDAYLLLGALLLGDNYREAMQYKLLAAKKFIEIEDFSSSAILLTSVADILLKHNLKDEAFIYNDSALSVLKGTNAYIDPTIYGTRSKLFETVGNTDSAYFYFRKYHDIILSEKNKMEISKIKQISEQYQNDKKEAVIQNRERLLFFISSLLALIILGAILLFRKNRKIAAQNKIINTQLADLSKTLEQKQVLLSELQHRVKNNLQHVISILEIQKESVDFNNIDELIRGNQNRIHSMALLHKKLNVSDNVNDVDLKQYIDELSELVKDSYNSHKKKISLNIKCEVERISIEKALPIGLIITELVSNSMKHAFKKRSIGIISIEITKEENTNMLYYSDNGSGFDFYKANEKGLGQEIVKGLIDQLNGNVEARNDNGFELTIYFK